MRMTPRRVPTVKECNIYVGCAVRVKSGEVREQRKDARRMPRENKKRRVVKIL